jgi:hypothetical protein
MNSDGLEYLQSDMASFTMAAPVSATPSGVRIGRVKINKMWVARLQVAQVLLSECDCFSWRIKDCVLWLIIGELVLRLGLGMTHGITGAAIALAIGLAAAFSFDVSAGHAQQAPCNPAVQTCT